MNCVSHLAGLKLLGGDGRQLQQNIVSVESFDIVVKIIIIYLFVFLLR